MAELQASQNASSSLHGWSQAVQRGGHSKDSQA